MILPRCEGLLESDLAEASPCFTHRWNTVPKLLFLPRFLDRVLLGALSREAASARRDVLALLTARGLDAVFVAMNEALPPHHRRATTVELADEIMTAVNFAGVNGTTHLLVSTLAHLRGATSDIPSDALDFPPPGEQGADLVALYRRDPDAFVLESCRVDPPVTSACATFVEEGQTITLGAGCGGGCGGGGASATKTTRVKPGTPLQYVFGGLAGPNRDPRVFARPNRFDPARKDLRKLLSWNGPLDEAAACPRFCPGQELSMIVVRAILGSIDELRDDAKA